MATDRRLANAPLVEVIAEVHWRIGEEAGEGKSDPEWFKFSYALGETLKPELPFREEVVPAGFAIPLDALGRSPLLRFRPKANTWPLVQIGQGLLSVNATPPYDGWEAVRAWLRKALDAAADAHPRSSQIVIERAQLQYRDAFSERHGVSSPIQFLQELGLMSLGAERIVKRFGATGPAKILSGEVGFDSGTLRSHKDCRETRNRQPSGRRREGSPGSYP